MTRFREWAKPRFQDFAMRLMDDPRPETVNEASGDVLEIGFGTGRTLKHYADDVESVHGIDPLGTQGVRLVEERIEQVSFPVRRAALSADHRLPFDAHRTHSTNEVRAIDLVSVPNDVPGRRVVGEGIDQLLACPLCGRTLGDVEMHDASALVLKH